jgi:hypothetical protein
MQRQRTHRSRKGNSRSHTNQTVRYSRKLARDAGFTFIGDISGAQVQEFLAKLKAKGKSISTCNHYRNKKRLVPVLVPTNFAEACPPIPARFR